MPTDECAQRETLEGSLTFVNPMNEQEEVYEQVGVRWRGHSALNEDEYARVGLKIAFDAYMTGREFYDFDKVNLMGTEGDYSLMREHLALRVARDMGIEAPRSAYAHLFVNDVYMGFYPLTEEADDGEYVRNHFTDGGALFKVEGYCGGRGDFEDEGDDPLDYVDKYDLKGGTPDEAITTDLLPLIECVNTPDDADFEACIPEHIDVENWLTEIAVDVALPDIDGMIGAGQNYMFYKYPDLGVFVIWPWDKDLALTDSNLNEDWDLAGVHPTWASDFRNLLGDRLVRSWRSEYCDIVLDVADRYDSATFSPEIEEHAGLIAPWIDADPWMEGDRWGWITDDVIDVVDIRHPEIVSRARACSF